MRSKLSTARFRKLAGYERRNLVAGSGDLFSAVRGKVAEMSNNHRRVAQLLLDEPQWLVRASVAEIAAKLQVSAPTIVRFARKVGYDGLRDLKLKLAGAMALREQAGTRIALREGDTEEIVRSVTGGLTTVIADWGRQIDPAAFDGAANAIHRARQIMCVGGNAFSNFLAQKLQGELYRLGYNAHSLADITYQLMAAGTLTADDVLVVISLVGQLPALLRAIELAKARGVFVVAITRGDTALAEKSDLVLRIEASNDPMSLQGIDASVLQTVAIEVLIVLMGLKQGSATLLNQRSPDAAQIMNIYRED
jgi:RpiR family carbohydrate utilization transcriptional regulator